MTNAEARFNKSLRPRKPEGSLGRTAQDVHLDSHTAPELWVPSNHDVLYTYLVIISLPVGAESQEIHTGGSYSYIYTYTYTYTYTYIYLFF